MGERRKRRRRRKQLSKGDIISVFMTKMGNIFPPSPSSSSSSSSPSLCFCLEEEDDAQCFSDREGGEKVCHSHFPTFERRKKTLPSFYGKLVDFFSLLSLLQPVLREEVLRQPQRDALGPGRHRQVSTTQ